MLVSSPRRSLVARFALAASLAWPNASPALADLVHRYTFNDGTANDSVGTAHGTVIDPGAPTAVFTTSGSSIFRLTTARPAALTTRLLTAPTEDAYVDLPNLIIEERVEERRPWRVQP